MSRVALLCVLLCGCMPSDGRLVQYATPLVLERVDAYCDRLTDQAVERAQSKEEALLATDGINLACEGATKIVIGALEDALD